MKICIDSPYPVSFNRAWRVRRLRGRVVVHRSDVYKKWQKQFGLEWLAQKPRDFKRIDGPFEVVIILSPVKKRAHDLENRIKVLLDACQVFGIIDDDIHCRRHAAWFGTPEEAPMGARIIIRSLDKLGLDTYQQITQIGGTE
jgi:Holliday junction resolvase RusA-like endonuclease